MITFIIMSIEKSTQTVAIDTNLIIGFFGSFSTLLGAYLGTKGLISQSAKNADYQRKQIASEIICSARLEWLKEFRVNYSQFDTLCTKLINKIIVNYKNMDNLKELRDTELVELFNLIYEKSKYMIILLSSSSKGKPTIEKVKAVSIKLGSMPNIPFEKQKWRDFIQEVRDLRKILEDDLYAMFDREWDEIKDKIGYEKFIETEND